MVPGLHEIASFGHKKDLQNYFLLSCFFALVNIMLISISD